MIGSGGLSGATILTDDDDSSKLLEDRLLTVDAVGATTVDVPQDAERSRVAEDRPS
jgi:hypothetical protein